jgi:hypothetical protein
MLIHAPPSSFGGEPMANQGTISVMSRVAVTFFNKEGGKYTLTPLVIDKNAPEWIQHDAMFGWLLQDGSLELINTPSRQRKLENDPTAGTGPDGKAKPATGGKGGSKPKGEGNDKGDSP